MLQLEAHTALQHMLSPQSVEGQVGACLVTLNTPASSFTCPLFASSKASKPVASLHAPPQQTNQSMLHILLHLGRSLTCHRHSADVHAANALTDRDSCLCHHKWCQNPGHSQQGYCLTQIYSFLTLPSCFFGSYCHRCSWGKGGAVQYNSAGCRF